MNRALCALCALAASILPAIFLVGPLVFGDGGMAEKLAFAGITGGVYVVLGLATGWWSRTWTRGLWLAVPGVLAAVLLGEVTLSPLQIPPVTGLTLLAIIMGSGLGLFAGARLRARRRRA